MRTSQCTNATKYLRIRLIAGYIQSNEKSHFQCFQTSKQLPRCRRHRRAFVVIAPCTMVDRMLRNIDFTHRRPPLSFANFFFTYTIRASGELSLPYTINPRPEILNPKLPTLCTYIRPTKYAPLCL